MQPRSHYDLDTAFVVLVRLLLYSAILAAMPFIIAGCSSTSGSNGGRFNATASADYQQLTAGGTDNQTRNQLPQRGADEKSDSSLTKPPI